MCPELLEALLARNRELAEKIGGFTIPEDFVINVRTLRTRLRQLHARPEAQHWLLRAIVLKQSQTMCGRIGFHSEPGPEELRYVAADGVELGYEIGESFRRQGIGKEAAIGLMKWAYEEHDQRCFVLSIARITSHPCEWPGRWGFEKQVHISMKRTAWNCTSRAGCNVGLPNGQQHTGTVE